MSELVETEELARRLHAPIHTVHYWRAKGIGPKGVRVGRRVLYRWADVESWLDKRAAQDPMSNRPQN